MTPFGEHSLRFSIPEGAPRRRLLAELSSIAGAVDVVLGERLGCVSFADAPDAPAVDRVLRLALGSEDVSSARHRIEVVYDGEDLEDVAKAIGGTTKDVIRLHTSRDLSVAMTGFLPGFAYLRGLPPELELPRRPPRPRVPAGSVAVGGGYAGVYPFASPGGWHLLGRATSFEPFAADRAVLSLGDTVRFVESSGSEARAARKEDVAASSNEPHLEVTRAAGLALFVDGGRRGRMHEGVPPGGPLVPSLFLRANALAGNDASACALEIAGTFEVVATRGDVVIADDERRIVLAEGERHVVSSGGRRVRYLALAGGFDAPLRLGGRGALLVANIGRPLRRGDRLASLRVAAKERALPPVVALDGPISFRPGPDRVSGFSAERLASTELRIGTASDRTGTRLEGAPFEIDPRVLSLPSSPMVKGAIELTPSGPIVLGPDHPTTGGYPVVGIVTERGLETLFSRPLGASVRLALW